MTTIGQISVAFVADTKRFKVGIDQATNQLVIFNKKTERTEIKLSKLTKRLGLVGAAFGAISAVKWGVQLAAEAETAQVALSTVLGNDEQAEKLIESLRKLASQTPLSSAVLLDAGTKLAAFGTEAEAIPGKLSRIGDVATSLGIPLSEMAELYGKMQVQGRLFAEDINQLTGRGIPIIEELAKKFGNVRKAVESGQVSFADLDEAIMTMTSEGGKFFGGMIAKSKTLEGQWSTLKDHIAEIARELSETILPILTLMTKRANKAIKHSGIATMMRTGFSAERLGREFVAHFEELAKPGPLTEKFEQEIVRARENESIRNMFGFAPGDIPTPPSKLHLDKDIPRFFDFIKQHASLPRVDVDASVAGAGVMGFGPKVGMAIRKSFEDLAFPSFLIAREKEKSEEARKIEESRLRKQKEFAMAEHKVLAMRSALNEGALKGSRQAQRIIAERRQQLEGIPQKQLDTLQAIQAAIESQPPLVII